MGFKRSVLSWAAKRRNVRRRTASWGIAKRRRTWVGRRRLGRRTFRRKGGAGLYQLKMRQPVADVLVTRHSYVQSEVATIPDGYTNLGTLTDSKAHRVWQTSMYDPDPLVGGHQPMFYDQLRTQYNKYRVHGIKYTLTIMKKNMVNIVAGVQAYATQPMGWLFIEFTPSGSTRSSTLGLFEDPNVRKFKIMGDTKVIKVYMPTHKALGITREDFLADETTIATIDTNPARMGFLSVYFVSMVRDADCSQPNEWCITHNLTYLTQWSDRIFPTTS